MIINLKNEQGKILLQIDTDEMRIGTISAIDSIPPKSSIDLIYGDKTKKLTTKIVELSPEKIMNQILVQCPEYFTKHPENLN